MRLAADGDFPLVAADADAPESQVPGDEADQAADPPGLNQVMVGGQRENRVDFFRFPVQLGFNRSESLAGQDQFPGLEDQHGDFRPGCLAVDDGDFLAGFLLLHHPLCRAGAVVAAGERAGDREGQHRPLRLEFPAPVLRRRAGGLRHFAVVFVGGQHLLHRHAFIVNILPAADPDRKGNRGEIKSLPASFQRMQIAACIRYDVPHVFLHLLRSVLVRSRFRPARPGLIPRAESAPAPAASSGTPAPE